MSELKQSRIMWTSATTESAIAKRTVFSNADGGRRVKVTILPSSAPAQIVKDKTGAIVKRNDGTVLYKRIYNVRAVNADAIPRMLPILEDAKTAEAAGNAQHAADLFNEFLNRIGISFNITSGNRLFGDDLSNKEIEAVLQLVVTDNGTLLTIDESTISVLQATAGASSANLRAMLFAKKEPAPEVTDGAALIQHPAEGETGELPVGATAPEIGAAAVQS